MEISMRLGHLLILILVALPLATPAAGDIPPGWTPVPDADWLLGEEIVYLRDLADTLQTFPGLNGLTVAPYPGHGYRIDPALYNGVDSLFGAAGLSQTTFDSLTAAGVVMRHDFGLSPDEMDEEVNGAADSLEALTGIRPRSLAYPRHIHTRELMTRLRDEGWIAARDGGPHGSGGGEPTASFLLGHHSEDDWQESWEHYLPWEQSTHTGFTERAVQSAIDLQDMSDLIHDTVNYNATHPGVTVFTYDFDSLAELWIHNRKWVHVYVHGEPADPHHLDAPHLAMLMDVLLADGRFWIADVATIAEWAMARHEPSDEDSLIYEPLVEEEELPWNGRRCAFSFSSDDGLVTNVAYADTLLARGLSMTAYITVEFVDHGSGLHLTTEELQGLVARGNVEIGSHSMSHPRMIPEEALILRNEGPQPIALRVVDDEDGRHLRFYRYAESTVPEAPIAGPPVLALHPNPFNPRLELTLELPAPDRVQVQVLDIRGRRLRTLLDRRAAAGTLTLNWDGCDDRGRALPSGLYLIRAATPVASTVSRAVLLR
jgi:hypothetical protein